MCLSNMQVTFQSAAGPPLAALRNIYKDFKRQQLDFHFGVGLSSAAVDHFIGIGYSFRFQTIKR